MAEGVWSDIESLVEEHGVAIQHVLAGDDGPAFSYTIGLSAVGHPEVLAVDLPRGLAGPLLNDLASAVLRSGMSFHPQDRVHRLIASGPAVLLDGRGTEDLVLGAVRFRDERQPADAGEALAVLHLVLSDRHGRWPWDEGCETAAQVSVETPPDPAGGREISLPSADGRRADGWPGMEPAMVPPHQKVIVCNHVFRSERPVRYVTRPDGDWCLLCGEADHEEAGSSFKVVGIGHELAKDATLDEVLDLAPDEEAERSDVGGPWLRSPIR